RFFHALDGIDLPGQVDSLLLFEFGQNVVHEPVVEVVSAQVGVAVGRQNFEGRFAFVVSQLQDSNVEGSAAKVVYGDLFVFFALDSGRQSGRGRLVDNTLNVEAGDLSSVVGGLALSIVKVGRNGNDRFSYRFAQVSFGVCLDLLQH